jgi:tRNA A-37 threonylcarbamoyl transferase component Bud32
VTDHLEHVQQAVGDRYLVEREIGRGGMAVVYLAQDTRYDRRVAIKVLRPELASALGPERFLREIEIEARLQHPSILPLYDSGVHGNVLFYVMPFVEGETLRERLERERQLPVEDVVRITRDLADALAYAHSLGIVHRDIKPENVFLAGDRAIVGDFGIARAVTAAGGQRLTETGMIIGTPAYMSPEQGSGQATIDGRSDLYSLACVTYEMLAGEPPFSGSTAQAVIARHLQDAPPSLGIVRPLVSEALEEAIERGLAKVPADRYTTVSGFADDVAAGAAVGARQRRRPRTGTRRWAPVVLGAVVLVAGAVTGRALLRERPRLDRTRVIVFPLSATGTSPAGEGESVALMIGSMLEHSEPLQWLYGWTWLGDRERADVRRLSADSARAISRAQRAGFYIDGSIVRESDSVTVVLLLHDVARGTVAGRASRSGQAPPAQLGARAVVELLPTVIGLDQPLDVAATVGASPAAVANWLLGEQQYRQSQFDSALTLLRRAVQADSGLAVAALRGAQACEWANRPDLVPGLMAVARAGLTHLSPRHRLLAGALERYFAGDADSAVRLLRHIVAQYPEWSDGWMLAGEVQLHEIPTITLDSMAARSVPPLLEWSHDSLSAEAFSRTRRIDPGFAPALVHLAEYTLRRGDVERASGLIAEYRRTSTDTTRLTRLVLMEDCVRRGSDHARLRMEAAVDPTLMVQVGRLLAPSPNERGRACAKAAFTAVLRDDSAPEGTKWFALLGLQGMLLAEGDTATVRSLLDSTAAAGSRAVPGLYVLDGTLGAHLGPSAGRFINALYEGYAERGTPALWLVGSWAAAQGNRVMLDQVTTTLTERADSTGRRLDRLVAGAMHAHWLLLEGDTGTALRELEALRPTGPGDDLAWSLFEPLAGERLVLARTLLARGQYVAAYRVASVFDHPQPLVFRAYEALSLAIRARAADALGETALANQNRRRLVALGRADLARAVP